MDGISDHYQSRALQSSFREHHLIFAQAVMGLALLPLTRPTKDHWSSVE